MGGRILSRLRFLEDVAASEVYNIAINLCFDILIMIITADKCML